MKIKVFGKIWEFLFVPKSALPKDCYGECDAPDVRGKEIRIRDDLIGEELLDTIIHECLHGAAFSFNEHFVDTVSTDIARAIWKPEVLCRLLNDPKAKGAVLERLKMDSCG
jgi:hypothetical protein